VHATAISGETPKDDRRNILRSFAAGRIQVLTNCNVLTEGFDEPSVNCIVHARPTKSSLLYIQMTGRGTRPSPATGKTDCLVLDCVDIAAKHSLVTVADLVGLPAKFDAKGADVLRTKKELDELRAANPHLNVSGARSFAEIQVRVRDLDLWKAPEPPPVLQKHAALSWVPAFDGDAFSLTYPTGDDEQGRKTSETVECRVNQLGQWDITVDGVALPIAPPPASADAALSAAETWVTTNRRHVLALVKKDARWRQDPATDNQLKWLKKKRVPHDPATISKGEASRLLDIAFGKTAAR
jgi:ATP-dependent helicase IRC3